MWDQYPESLLDQVLACGTVTNRPPNPAPAPIHIAPVEFDIVSVAEAERLYTFIDSLNQVIDAALKN